jgi:stringent starvation protein B
VTGQHVELKGEIMSRDSKNKADVVLKLLEEGDTMLCLDARCAGVTVPPQFADNPSLQLILNLNFPYPIEVTDAGVSANLAFGGRRFACYVPMEALWAAFNPQDMQGMMWPESMPSEVRAELTVQKDQASPDETSASLSLATPRATDKQKKTGTAQQKSDSPPASKRGHLRVVK